MPSLSYCNLPNFSDVSDNLFRIRTVHTYCFVHAVCNFVILTVYSSVVINIHLQQSLLKTRFLKFSPESLTVKLHF